MKYFNTDLIKRFVSDNNLPIPVLHDEDKFEYYLDLYECVYNSRTLWQNLCDEISVAYGGSVEAFLNDYYDIRDRMINDILDNPKYQEFLDTDMKQYSVCDELKSIPKGNVYNSDNIGKWFLSIDLKKANFQALRYFDPSLVKNEDTYEEYVSRYALDSEYIQNSKYTRQVVFGKCNTARQITIEKHLMSNFYQSFEYEKDEMKLVRFNNDELVFELPMYGYQNISERIEFRDSIESKINRAITLSGAKVSCTIYRLSAVCLHSVRTNKDRNLNYVLDCYGKIKFKEVPLAYNALVYKLYANDPLDKADYYFRYEGLDAYIDDEFILKRYNTKEEFINDKKEEN